MHPREPLSKSSPPHKLNIFSITLLLPYCFVQYASRSATSILYLDTRSNNMAADRLSDFKLVIVIVIKVESTGVALYGLKLQCIHSCHIF